MKTPNFLRWISIIVCLLILPINSTADSSIDSFIQRYYEHPDPDRLTEIYKWTETKGLLNDPRKAGSTVGIFGGLLNRNSKFVPVFIELGKGSNLTENGRGSLTMALWHCNTDQCKAALRSNPFSVPEGLFQETQQFAPKPLLEYVITNPSAVDTLWGWFTATGDTDAVLRIVQYASDYESSRGSKIPQSGKNSVNFTAEAARWSLISQAANHSKVMEVLKNCARRKKSCQSILDEAERKIQNKKAR